MEHSILNTPPRAGANSLNPPMNECHLTISNIIILDPMCTCHHHSEPIEPSQPSHSDKKALWSVSMKKKIGFTTILNPLQTEPLTLNAPSPYLISACSTYTFRLIHIIKKMYYQQTLINKIFIREKFRFTWMWHVYCFLGWDKDMQNLSNESMKTISTNLQP